MIVTTISVSLLGALIFFLSLNVSKHRIRHRVSIGDEGNKDIRNAVRAHANAIECIPIFCLLLMVYEYQAQGVWFHATVAGVFILARVSHAMGMTLYKLPGRFMMRRAGAGVTLLVFATLAFANLWVLIGRI